MQLPPDTHIAGWKTVAEWNALKSLLADHNNMEAWSIAYNDYYLGRLTDRYLTPLKAIKEGGSYAGEGFSMMAIICSLIEFLETTEQGINYRFRRNGDPELSEFQYGNNKSTDIFVSFLTKRSPFDTQFNTRTANDFYSNIRCGLLHEARTTGNWTIWGKSSTNVLLEDKGSKIIVFRDDFLAAINTYIESFKENLLASRYKKMAFIRKFESLCCE
jgi:hypothetical protein